MTLRSLFMAFQCFRLIAAASHAPSTLSNFVEPRGISPHKRSTGLYAAVLGGNGMVADGWPGIDQWVESFEAMFENNKGVISISCSQWGLPNNSEGETEFIHDAIQQVAHSSGVDARFILSIVMQESKGCVRVQTTDNGVVNPGLMQSHDGSGSCNKDGAIQNPCPESEIHQMIMDGVEGTSAGPGLKALIDQEGGSAHVASFYKAARAYNSGAVASSGNLGQGIATHCYASDIANRLMGWTNGPSLCAPNVIGVLSAAHWEGKSVSTCHGTAKTSHFRSTPSSHMYSLSSHPVASALDSPYTSGFATTPVVISLGTATCACSKRRLQAKRRQQELFLLSTFFLAASGFGSRDQ
ncbi:hypothetical protein N7520_009621 [Penicillium odoratum]|uniref:uncharacterized protein n=1 Tax=Penicillium odoratum TaxID=1167516 RepID=UPI0025489513|nr:uncharacterized protein N7520_009621 [Penicillium odoratum]KAJ5752704.1 hypothetical protein N7520_009621 [Penicillium odoratum]